MNKLLSKRLLFGNSLTISKISMIGILVGLQMILDMFLSFNLGPMQVSLDYVFFAMYGLIFGVATGSMIGVIADTLKQVAKGEIGQWMIEYAIIPIAIAIISGLVKFFIFDKKDKGWWMAIVITFVLVDIAALITILMNNSFGIYVKHDMTSSAMNIIFFVAFAIAIAFQIGVLVYYKKKKDEYSKTFANIFALFFVISVLISWLYGPIAQIRFLQHMGYGHYELNTYNYKLFLVPRVIKSLPEVMIWSLIGAGIYETLKISHDKLSKEKW